MTDKIWEVPQLSDVTYMYAHTVVIESTHEYMYKVHVPYGSNSPCKRLVPLYMYIIYLSGFLRPLPLNKIQINVPTR